MTSLEIATSVRRKILEEGTAIITDATLYSYINLAQLDIYKRVYPNPAITSATITCVAGACTLPSTFGTLYGPAYDTSGNSYEEVSIADFARKEFDRSITIEGGALKVYPTNIASLTIKHYPVPVTITSAVNPTINELFHECLVYGAIYRCQEDLQDESLSTYYRGLFKQELKDRIEAQSVYEETNQRGGVMFVEQSLINDSNHVSF